MSPSNSNYDQWHVAASSEASRLVTAVASSLGWMLPAESKSGLMSYWCNKVAGFLAFLLGGKQRWCVAPLLCGALASLTWISNNCGFWVMVKATGCPWSSWGPMCHCRLTTLDTGLCGGASQCSFCSRWLPNNSCRKAQWWQDIVALCYECMFLMVVLMNKVIFWVPLDGHGKEQHFHNGPFNLCLIPLLSIAIKSIHWIVTTASKALCCLSSRPSSSYVGEAREKLVCSYGTIVPL